MSIRDMNKVFGQQRQIARLAMSSDIVRLLFTVRGPLRKMVAPGNTIRGSERLAQSWGSNVGLEARAFTVFVWTRLAGIYLVEYFCITCDKDVV
jgi:hypothetical protein